MGYKTKEQRKKYYERNKDMINRKRREYSNKPDVRKRISERDKLWRIHNKQKISRLNKIYKKRYDIKLKKLVFDHYGWECSCCGEKNPYFLTIDHLDGNGTQHRKKINNHINVWLVKNNFPKAFQTLCFNCNWGKHINGGVCPHKIKYGKAKFIKS